MKFILLNFTFIFMACAKLLNPARLNQSNLREVSVKKTNKIYIKIAKSTTKCIKVGCDIYFMGDRWLENEQNQLNFKAILRITMSFFVFGCLAGCVICNKFALRL